MTMPYRLLTYESGRDSRAAIAIGDPVFGLSAVLKQDSNTGVMLFTIAGQIARLSSSITLHPGDVILTRPPAGVGAEAGQKLAQGDRARAEIESLGARETRIV